MDYKTRGFLHVIEVRYRVYMDDLEEDTGPGPRLRHAFSAAALFLIQPPDSSGLPYIALIFKSMRLLYTITVSDSKNPKATVQE